MGTEINSKMCKENWAKIKEKGKTFTKKSKKAQKIECKNPKKRELMLQKIKKYLKNLRKS